MVLRNNHEAIFLLVIFWLVLYSHELAARGSRGPAWRTAVGYDEASLAKK
jgi:hypothetical protein